MEPARVELQLVQEALQLVEGALVREVPAVLVLVVEAPRGTVPAALASCQRVGVTSLVGSTFGVLEAVRARESWM